MADFQLLEMLGVPVYECAALRDDVCWIADQGVALIRPDLSPERRRAAGEWLLSVALFPASVR